MFEDRLASLEGAEACRTTATGMAAVHGAVLGLLKAGDHAVARAMFGSCRWIIEDMLPRFGMSSTLVDGTDLETPSGSGLAESCVEETLGRALYCLGRRR